MVLGVGSLSIRSFSSFREIRSVSYTHLDVYKRQIHIPCAGAAEVAIHNASLIRLVASISPDDGITIVGFNHIITTVCIAINYFTLFF